MPAARRARIARRRYRARSALEQLHLGAPAGALQPALELLEARPLVELLAQRGLDLGERGDLFGATVVELEDVPAAGSFDQVRELPGLQLGDASASGPGSESARTQPSMPPLCFVAGSPLYMRAISANAAPLTSFSCTPFAALMPRKAMLPRRTAAGSVKTSSR